MSSTSNVQESASGVVADLRDAHEARREAADAVAEVGEDTAERVADAVDRAETLLDKYESSATGTGDFQSFVSFQGDVDDLLDDLPEDFPAREAFEAYDDRLDKRRLSESDFERARDALSPARDYRRRLRERADARERHREAVGDVRDRLEAVESRISDLDRLQELGEADLDAPVDDLRDPIEAYDDAVREEFDAFRSNAPARAVLEFADTAARYPLVGVRDPPDDLLAYVRAADAGTDTVDDLLEYADYSRSKLDHYVDQPRRLKRVVAGNRTYLDRLDAEPLTVDWPPRPADELRYRARELVSVVARFADDDVVAHARDVRDLALRDDYARLRRAAVARTELSAEERDRLESGAVAEELDDFREERATLEDALDEYA